MYTAPAREMPHQTGTTSALCMACAVARRRTEGDGCARESSRAGDASDLATVLTHLGSHRRHLSRAVCAQPNTILGSAMSARESFGSGIRRMRRQAEQRAGRTCIGYLLATRGNLVRYSGQPAPHRCNILPKRMARPEQRGARHGGHSQPAPGAPWLICAPVIVQPRGSSVWRLSAWAASCAITGYGQ